MSAVTWRELHAEGFTDVDGRYQRLFILETGAQTKVYYAGPGRGTHSSVVPLFNGSRWLHRTQDAAMTALIDMMSQSAQEWGRPQLCLMR